MSRDFAEMLEAATPTDEVMDVDTSFLDAYRRGGSEELKRVQAQAAPPEPEAATPEPEAQFDETGDIDSQLEVEGPQADLDGEAETDRPNLEPDREPDVGDSERAGRSNQRGGAGGGQNTADGVLPGGVPRVLRPMPFPLPGHSRTWRALLQPKSLLMTASPHRTNPSGWGPDRRSSPVIRAPCRARPRRGLGQYSRDRHAPPVGLPARRRAEPAAHQGAARQRHERAAGAAASSRSP